jgi:SpoVK/Ycf46/Vps4 family AAA+-type ATPase
LGFFFSKKTLEHTQRGGKGGSGGDQGDAGVARDSVVNQLLAKMDGSAPLKFPTLIIGLTNKRSLIDPALLRPGRFEVHIEVPPPVTIEQRVSILKVHTRDMHLAGRLYVRDAPVDSPAAAVAAVAAARAAPHDDDDYSNPMLSPPEYTYLELLEKIAQESDGFSGASLAAVARSAASYALERAVEDFAMRSGPPTGRGILNDCLVTFGDLQKALDDVRSVGETDYAGADRPVSDDKLASQPMAEQDLQSSSN